ncbi:MAG: ABC-type spermidine/putrescine transport system, permease component II [uncultured Paraburkholderia sp.]|nr:MAG: ABC-type spermidine/putrescine transport system, permease component II [uncultured Paraburkholderia sp.]CAH2799181.1 MAG: ABC-type spermidine/putrescine transport system, permease component II [uncultured Paraburkholderia sp.]CAH2934127.1 MAG: ABC-type spermidine/putrescine transport system, permease component II [uncultured Paraburkholderia sp.]CAH2934858.1 MAG: ABC-type spermidine/putrescine transport system, permease component II [uncultured Paraburkholderia sp.]
MRKNGPIALIFHALVIAFVLAPLVIVVLVTFTPDETLTLPTHGVSLRWFRAILNYPDFIAAFFNSLKLAFASATLSLIVALLRFFALIGAAGSFTWLIVAHMIIITPFVMRLVLASVSGLDRSVEHAAHSLGADPWTTFRRITLPMILPGITGGWLLAFINSFDELTMSIFVTSPQTVTLPVRMYMYATESIDPMMASVSTLVIFITAGAMLLLDRVYGLNRILIGQH